MVPRRTTARSRRNCWASLKRLSTCSEHPSHWFHLMIPMPTFEQISCLESVWNHLLPKDIRKIDKDKSNPVCDTICSMPISEISAMTSATFICFLVRRKNSGRSWQTVSQLCSWLNHFCSEFQAFVCTLTFLSHHLPHLFVNGGHADLLCWWVSQCFCCHCFWIWPHCNDLATKCSDIAAQYTKSVVLCVWTIWNDALALTVWHLAHHPKQFTAPLSPIKPPTIMWVCCLGDHQGVKKMTVQSPCLLATGIVTQIWMLFQIWEWVNETGDNKDAWLMMLQSHSNVEKHFGEWQIVQKSCQKCYGKPLLQFPLLLAFFIAQAWR